VIQREDYKKRYCNHEGRTEGLPDVLTCLLELLSKELISGCEHDDGDEQGDQSANDVQVYRYRCEHCRTLQRVLHFG
jgi:hypothetical protein